MSSSCCFMTKFLGYSSGTSELFDTCVTAVCIILWTQRFFFPRDVMWCIGEVPTIIVHFHTFCKHLIYKIIILHTIPSLIQISEDLEWRVVTLYFFMKAWSIESTWNCLESVSTMSFGVNSSHGWSHHASEKKNGRVHGIMQTAVVRVRSTQTLAYSLEYESVRKYLIKRELTNVMNWFSVSQIVRWVEWIGNVLDHVNPWVP